MSNVMFFKPLNKKKPFYYLLNDFLRRSKQFEFLSGYNSNGALALIKDSLDYFKSKGGTGKFFFPLINNQTSIDLVKGLLFYDNLELYGIKSKDDDSGIIHSKIYVFYEENKATALVGSANFTLFGLMKNFETVSLINLNKSSNLIYNQVQEFELVKLTIKNIHHYEKFFGSNQIHRGKHGETEGQLLREKFPSIMGNSLFLEKYSKETGGGSQIQIPKKAFLEYFGGHSGLITIELNGDLRLITLSKFDNYTYRVSINELKHLSKSIVIFKENKVKDKVVTYSIEIVGGKKAINLLDKSEFGWCKGKSGRRYKIINNNP
ncbi:MAG: NgoFVII family restriction endonuclease [Nanoarchaeota archaeon]|nr:NgoFVII family restriction endonuclease [Nanoarchaeota archaeon]